MAKVFIINGAQKLAHSGGRFNQSLVDLDAQFFTEENGFEVKITNINAEYVALEEVGKFVWADIIIYHFPVWWFSLPFKFKEYIDLVFTVGHRKGMYHSDGRKAVDPDLNYGKGGSLHGRKYMITTSLNAPEASFKVPGEFFNEVSVDEGMLYGFHKMNVFLGLEKVDSIHFHDLEKNVTDERVQSYLQNYQSHLVRHFADSTNILQR